MTFFLLLNAGEESTISSQPLTVNYVVNLTVIVPRAGLKLELLSVFSGFGKRERYVVRTACKQRSCPSRCLQEAWCEALCKSEVKRSSTSQGHPKP